MTKIHKVGKERHEIENLSEKSYNVVKKRKKCKLKWQKVEN